jgi:AcrR family transcriptional regulator
VRREQQGDAAQTEPAEGPGNAAPTERADGPGNAAPTEPTDGPGDAASTERAERPRNAGATRTRTPRTGRRPGPSSTRDAILDAARRLFMERGYDGATMRAIAAEAGVDAALVVHFFGNKATLLAEAVDWPFDPEVEMPKLLVDGRKHVGRHVVELFVRTWDDERDRSPIITLIRAATTEPRAAELLRSFLHGRLFTPLMARLDVDQPDLRMDLVISQMVGLGMTRYVLGLDRLASAEAAEIVELVGPTVQRYLTGRLEPRASAR